jgi:hypothetical protein
MTERTDRAFEWRDIGDGRPVRVQVCGMCGVAPSNVDDCGEFGNPECPYFGIGREDFERRAAAMAEGGEQ